MSPAEIGIEQIRSFIEQPQAQVLEVLPPPEYHEQHLPGALNIPLKSLDEDAASQLDPDRPTVVYCWDYQ